MKRLTIFLTFFLAFCGMGLTASSVMAIDGPLANATVSFGQWNPNDPDLLPAEVPLDRLTGDPPMGRGNDHLLIPQTATIKEGGTVNFIISGGHVVAVYDDGTQPEDINLVNIEPAANCPTAAGGVLSDSNNRIYRGPCFSTNFGTTPPTTIVRRDGVEVVQFTKPGTYLVICARKNHFVDDGMFGFVRVLPGGGNEK
jgi:plastocyanin